MNARSRCLIPALALLLLLAPAAAAATEGVVSGPTLLEERLSILRADLEDILRSARGRLRSGRWGVLAVSLDRGDTLFAESPDAPLAPASNMKLLTTAAALQELGPDFRYQTFLLARGPVIDGRLEGDLVLYGTGDPGISDRFFPGARAAFHAFADSLLAAGVRVVTGAVVGDGSYFAGPVLGEGWNPNDLNDAFAAPSGALSYNENVFQLRVRAARDGGTEILTLPAGAGVPVRNESRSGGSGPLLIRRAHPLDPILVQGSLGGGEVWRQMTVPDPAHFAASVLRTLLLERGIEVLGEARAAYQPEESPVTGRQFWATGHGFEPPPRVLARHLSPPLQQYLEVINKRSHNLLADQVLRTLGRLTSGDGSYAAGGRALVDFMAESVGVDPTPMAVYDGSGLSSLNRVSASDFVALIGHMARSSRWDPFWETLPEAGNPRELRRMSRTAAAGNLRAKTGTIQSVSALSGLVHSANGERIAFSIIANQVPSTSSAKGIEDLIGSRLARFERPLAEEAVLAEAETPAEPTLDATEEAPPGLPQAPGPESSEPDPARRHQVRPGETLSGIAGLYAVSVSALVEANAGVTARRLQVGSWLTIP